jgi:sec-independent protein translocase protein TatA
MPHHKPNRSNHMNALIAGMLSGPEITIICIVVLILFGGAAIPKFAKNLGKAKKEFEDGIKEGKKESKDEKKESDDAKKDDQ